MKQCTVCSVKKDIIAFPKKGAQCKSCRSSIDKAQYAINAEAKKAKSNEYYAKNRETILAKIDKPKKKIYRKKYYEENKDAQREYKKQYKRLNRTAITLRESNYRKANKDKINARVRNRKKTDPLYKLGFTMRKRTDEVLKDRGIEKSMDSMQWLGCTKEELFVHIENQFTPEMTWGNHGPVWHLDHKIPLSAAKTEAHIYALSHYKNFQPLLANINLIKNNKIVYCWQKLEKDKQESTDRLAGFNFNLTPGDFTFAIEDFKPEHRAFISKYEWLGTVGFAVRWVFTARYQNELAGVVMISEPNNYQFGDQEALIQRGAVSSWAPKNLNSKLVMFGCRWMVANTDKRFFVAYSDPDAGEIGTIYQACNFDYLGQTFGTDYLYVLENGRQVSGRYFTRTSTMKKWAKENNIIWQPEWCKENGFQNTDLVPQILKDYAKMKRDSCKRIKQTPKGKYVLLLNYGKQKFQKTWIPKPYPKREIF